MNDFETFQVYISVKNHFNVDSYNYFRYNGKNRLKVSSFEKRKDKIFFLKLAKHPDLVNFLVANFSFNPKMWIKELAYSEEAEKRYKDWIKYQQSISYNFKQDLKKLDSCFNKNFIVSDNEHPILLKLYLGSEVSLETLCLLVEFSSVLKYWNKTLNHDPLWDSIKSKIEKYTPFIQCDKEKLKKICLDEFSDI
jgi:hypothetical protein